MVAHEECREIVVRSMNIILIAVVFANTFDRIGYMALRGHGAPFKPNFLLV